MEKIKPTLKKNTESLDPYAQQIPPLVDLSKKLDVNPGLLLAGVLFIVGLVILLVYGWQIMLTLVTVLYPSLHSIRAIETKQGDDDKVWLTYWLIYGFTVTFEVFLPFVCYYLPYYDWLRLLFFIFLLMPQTQGAKLFYENVLREVLRKNQGTIHGWIKRTKTSASKLQDEATKVASDPSVISQGVSMAAKAQNKIASGVNEPQEAKNDD